jgi:uncharacterized membrane protein YciS (DUF1049 family)
VAKDVVPQTYANHTRFVVGYHFVALFLLFVNLCWSVLQVFRYFSMSTVVAALLAVALVILFLYARTFPMTVQDRVIRLEMRLRMEKLLPADVFARFGEFAVGQLVALRFASDAELPALARKVLDEKIASRAEIKKLIKDWQPDYLRA